MADTTIRISTEALHSTATEVRNINKALDQDLTDIKQKMNALEATWRSDAADDIRQAMNNLQPRFDEYKSVVEAYATFLVNTAQSYENTESSIQNLASAFK